MVRKVDTPRQKIPPEFDELLEDPQLSANMRKLVEALSEQFNRFMFWDWQMYQRVGGADDAIAETQIGELYEPGIQTVDNELLESLDDDRAFSNVLDFTERLEDIENTLHCQGTDVEERFENLENIFQFSPDVEERVEDLENKFSGGNDLNERVEDLENQFPGGSDIEERVQDLEVDLVGTPADSSQVEMEIIVVTADFTTTGNQIIVCNNTTSITITLNTTPDDGEIVKVKRFNTGAVDVTSARGIDNSPTESIPSRYDQVPLYFIDEIDEWIVI